jgi:parvulin-like peptidyl-prolyl isomerase
VAALAVLCLTAGCSGRNITADNPVLGRVPIRTSLAEPAADHNESLTADARGAEAGVDQVAFEDAAQPKAGDLSMSNVAAVVDGTPILVSDILEPHAANLAKAEKQLSPARFAELREQVLRRDLPRYIDDTVLMNVAVAQLDADKRAQVDQQLDEFFKQWLKGIQTELQAGTVAELEAKLQAQGTTLSSLRRTFTRQQLAKQGMMLHRGPEPTVTRQELLDEYQKRIADYQHPPQVKWQQIWISHRKHGGEDKASGVLQQAIGELRQGADFAAVAQKYSDGATANDGGHWDWTQMGSLSNPQVERQLFELGVGEIGQVIAEEHAFQLVRVIERRPHRVTPFEEVQADLRKELIEQKKKTLADDVVKRLKEDAVITTMFDAA